MIDRPIEPAVFEAEINPYFSTQNDPRLEERARAAIGQIANGSILITDITLSKMGNLLDRNSLSAYKNLWESDYNSDEDLRTAIEAIRNDGRQPVTLSAAIGDHFDHFKVSPEEIDKMIQLQNRYYSDIDIERGWGYVLAIKDKFDVPFILSGGSYHEIDHLIVGYAIGDRYEEVNCQIPRKDYIKIVGVLQAMGVNPEKAVLLVDHHLYNLSPEQIQEWELDQVDITPICSCCIGMGRERNADQYKSRLERLGYHLYPINNRLAEEAADGSKGKMELVIDNLVSQIQDTIM